MSTNYGADKFFRKRFILVLNGKKFHINNFFIQ